MQPFKKFLEVLALEMCDVKIKTLKSFAQEVLYLCVYIGNQCCLAKISKQPDWIGAIDRYSYKLDFMQVVIEEVPSRLGEKACS